MSESGRERECSTSSRNSSTCFVRNRQEFENDQQKLELSDRKRSHRQITIQHLEHPDRTVYVTNIPAEKITDQELIDLFSPYGMISDIRVFKDHLFVQYQRSEQADRLLEQSQKPLILRSKQLEIHSGQHYLSLVNRCSSKDKTTIKDDEPERKRLNSKQQQNSHSYHCHSSENHGRKDRFPLFSSKSSNDSRIVNPNNCYTILSGPTSPKELVDCQILIVNIRQRNYAEKIENRLTIEGLRTSIRLLREDFTLNEAVENAKNERSLYAIIAMPMHEERRTASFHILYGETEEHRNLALNDGFEIVLRNYASYRKRFGLDQIDSNCSTNEQLNEINPNENHPLNMETSLRLTINDRFPLSMLLCLLADGRQLTLDEIDRVLVYLLEKKAKMLTLPEGTLPPLPVQYANKIQSNHFYSNDVKQESNGNDRSTSKIDLSTEKCLTPSIAEQIRQMFATNHLNNSLEINSLNETRKSLIETNQKTNSINLNETYSNQSTTTTTTTTTNPSLQLNPLFISPALSSIQCAAMTTPQPVNSLFGSTFSRIQSATATNHSNGLNQSTDYLYSNPFSLNSSQLESIFQSYSQINPLSLLTSSAINQTLFNAQQQTKQEN